jgi:hypothetical protein
VKKLFEGDDTVPGVEEQAGKYFMGLIAKSRFQVLLGHIRAVQRVPPHQHFLEVAPGKLQYGHELGCFCRPQPVLLLKDIAVGLQ